MLTRLLVQWLDRDECPVRQAVGGLMLLGLARRRSAAAVVPEVARALRPGQSLRQAVAAILLGRAGGQAGTALPAVLGAMDDVDGGVRELAALALTRIMHGLPGDGLRACLPRPNMASGPLRRCLAREGEPRVRVAALDLLRRVGPAAADLGDAVESCLEDRHPLVRMSAAALVWTRADPARAVPALARLLDDEVARVRGIGARALAAFAPASRPAAGKLIDRLGDPDSSVRAAARLALEHLSPWTLPPTLDALAGGRITQGEADQLFTLALAHLDRLSDEELGELNRERDQVVALHGPIRVRLDVELLAAERGREASDAIVTVIRRVAPHWLATPPAGG